MQPFLSLQRQYTYCISATARVFGTTVNYFHQRHEVHVRHGVKISSRWVRKIYELSSTKVLVDVKQSYGTTLNCTTTCTRLVVATLIQLDVRSLARDSSCCTMRLKPIAETKRFNLWVHRELRFAIESTIHLITCQPRQLHFTHFSPSYPLLAVKPGDLPPVISG